MRFHVGDILSITTGRLLSPSGIDGVYHILNFMTGDNLFTHQLPRASDQCEPSLCTQFPLLDPHQNAKLRDAIARENWSDLISQCVSECGEYHEVRALEKGEYTSQNPIEELIDLLESETKIVVLLKEDET